MFAAGRGIRCQKRDHHANRVTAALPTWTLGSRAMKVRFAVAPHSGSLSATSVLAFADALEANGFDGVWASRSWWAGAEVDHHSARWSFTALAAAARPVQDPLEVWLGGRGPKALDRVGRIADGWLGATLTPQEARVARERIQASADRAGREIDPEPFGLSIAYARSAPEPALLGALTARRADIDLLALLPVGARAVGDGDRIAEFPATAD